jgi:uncharacterized protein (TIGR02246 family)
MRQSITATLLALTCLAFFWAAGTERAGAQAAANDEAALRATVDAYSASLGTGDLNAIMNHWSPDADFTSDSGDVTKGRDAIGKLMAANLAELKTGKSAVKIDTIRFLTNDVAAMDGAVEFTPANGPLESNRFSAVWARKNGRWIIASARDLPEGEEHVADRGMKELQWLVGEWTAQDRDTSIKLTVKSELDGKFAFGKFEIKNPKQTIIVYQMLGYDPTEGSLRAWTFDSRGGFGETVWERDGSNWAGDNAVVLPTGQVGTSYNTIQMMGPNQFKWHATNREIEGQPIPDSEITYNRVTTAR